MTRRKEISRNTLIGIIAAILVVLIILIFIIVKVASKPHESEPVKAGDASSKITTSSSSSKTSSDDLTSSESSSETATSQIANSSKSSSSSKKAGSTSKKSTIPTTPQPANQQTPATFNSDQVIGQVVQNIKALKTKTDAVSKVSSPIAVTLAIPENADESNAAENLTNQIKDILGYPKYVGQTSGNPFVFDYSYKIAAIGVSNGNRNFKLEYRLNDQHWSQNGCSSDDLVAQVRNHMQEKGIAKTDSLSNPNGLKIQRPIVSVAKVKNGTALNILKSTVDAISNQYHISKYDFYFYSECQNQGEDSLQFVFCYQ